MSETTKQQIKDRLQYDSEAFSDAFIKLSQVVVGDKFIKQLSAKQIQQATESIEAILRFYGIRDFNKPPKEIENFEQRLDYILRPLGIMRRDVILEKGWYKDAVGAFLGTLKDGTVIAMIPSMSGYIYIDNNSGKKEKISSKNASEISDFALCFYMPLPTKKLSGKDFLNFILKNLKLSDYWGVAVLTLVVTLISTITPSVTRYLYNDVLIQPSLTPLIAAFVILITTGIASLGIGSIKSFVLNRISNRMDKSILTALLMRTLNLPMNFFRKYQSGNLMSRFLSASTIGSTITSTILSTGITVIMSFVYLIQIFRFASILVVPALIILLVQIGYNIYVISKKTKLNTKYMQASADESGYLLSSLNGIQKIKLSGSERRVFAGWADKYKITAKYEFVLVYYDVISLAISLIGTLIIYYIGYRSGLGSADYMAFISSYGLLSGSFSTVSSAAIKYASVKSTLNMIDPIINEEPEIASDGIVVNKLNGKIDIKNISFRYEPDMPLIIDNLSLTINPGDYVAIVGKSGCGKSTLLKLLMGFEKPEKGTIFYDDIEQEKYEVKSLRQRMGIVMQTSGLFTGTIRNNLVATAPNATDEEIWQACEMAQIANDIRALPMGLGTLISEGSAGISGGQKQRLIIARAILAKPDMLFFDEATSALDNITQKDVADALSKMDCTRLVIAHRLTTVKNCDKILMLDKGKIIESGTYDELIQLDGEFAKLVKRQQI